MSLTVPLADLAPIAIRVWTGGVAFDLAVSLDGDTSHGVVIEDLVIPWGRSTATAQPDAQQLRLTLRGDPDKLAEAIQIDSHVLIGLESPTGPPSIIGSAWVTSIQQTYIYHGVATYTVTMDDAIGLAARQTLTGTRPRELATTRFDALLAKANTKFLVTPIGNASVAYLVADDWTGRTVLDVLQQMSVLFQCSVVEYADASAWDQEVRPVIIVAPWVNGSAVRRITDAPPTTTGNQPIRLVDASNIAQVATSDIERSTAICSASDSVTRIWVKFEQAGAQQSINVDYYGPSNPRPGGSTQTWETQLDAPTGGIPLGSPLGVMLTAARAIVDRSIDRSWVLTEARIHPRGGAAWLLLWMNYRSNTIITIVGDTVLPIDSAQTIIGGTITIRGGQLTYVAHLERTGLAGAGPLYFNQLPRPILAADCEFLATESAMINPSEIQV